MRGKTDPPIRAAPQFQRREGLLCPGVGRPAGFAVAGNIPSAGNQSIGGRGFNNEAKKLRPDGRGRKEKDSSPDDRASIRGSA
jgi:hypothetical protein